MLKRVKTMVLASCLAVSTASFAGYEAHPRAQILIDDLKADGFEESYIRDVLGRAKYQQSIIDAISRPAERRLNWGEYRAIFIEQRRINQAIQFWKEHKETLLKAEEIYGVPPEIILAIMGVETRFGRITGNYRVLDALATLGFDYPKRADFFLGQLGDYFRLARQEGVEPGVLKGSYAGAMGYGQFIPSSFLAYAVDFDGDQQRDIWGNPVDAIGSVANYFARHGWRAGEPIVSDVLLNGSVDSEWFNKSLKPELTLGEWRQRGVIAKGELADDQLATLMRMSSDQGDQYLLGLHNFYVITRYNHSRLYANAVRELSEAIRLEINKG
ncbi:MULTISPECIES: lytic murein transglycosylase B [unclassified Marinobacterium]|jgi:membrane-bound lytic murein transglycosylase B|uniref:lytic murein transglycosylase B n=1 Tax=unclassified Marinobacterium TaxID=2644139 RepID=UPI001568B31F|nr:MULTISPECIES: lytic murein transglycosylase B [unclassified Marinobacterium]NRP58213.1 Membrane-bound lytic murein transglycosylase B precursor [Marinobacterium sp. xm-d-510]NRP97435.1 Membrane-bound lytic murein transglycosylase B precursor [Marinobacterium sp. xm-a-127]